MLVHVQLLEECLRYSKYYVSVFYYNDFSDFPNFPALEKSRVGWTLITIVRVSDGRNSGSWSGTVQLFPLL